MLCDSAQVVWLAGKLRCLRNELAQLRVIYDPVLRASASGEPLDRPLLDVIKQQLLPLIDLLTPNTVEASDLLGTVVADRRQMVSAAQQLSVDYQCNVLLKGGHLIKAQQSIDCYVGLEPLLSPRFISEPTAGFALASIAIKTSHTRGSGCTLASVIAGLVAQQYTFCDAIVLAKSVTSRALESAHACGNGNGGLLDLALPSEFSQLPRIMSLPDFANDVIPNNDAPFAPCLSNLGLYPVVDSCRWLARLLKLGVKTIQLRVKDLPDTQAEPLVMEAIALGRRYQARVFINDYWQLAIKHQAYGVHLGQEDLTRANLAQIKHAGLRLGLSTHGIYEALLVNDLAPSYIALGHIYATSTKDMNSRPQGLDKLALQVALFKDQRTLVAIGGISAQRVPQVLASGITSVALVTAITKADDVERTTTILLEQVGNGGAHRCDTGAIDTEVAYVTTS